MEPFIGQIMLWAGNFAPRGWAFCDGSLLPISQNQSLFSLIGNVYGGDGVTNFALPDLRGRAAMGFGAGPGLTPRPIGQAPGYEGIQLYADNLPPHTHPASLKATSTESSGTDPDSAALGSGGRDNEYVQNATLDLTMQDGTVEVGPSPGNSYPVNNMQPSIVLNYVIALAGVFPQRS